MKKEHNPTMKKENYDIVVVGAGSGGLNVASFFGRLPLRVLLIDKSDSHIGGDCLNTGCVPSKALIHVANQIYGGVQAHRFYNSLSTHPEIDIQKVMSYVKSKQDFIRQSENPDYLRKKGITYISGTAVFTGTNSIAVEETEYTAKKIILATGSRPRVLDIESDNSITQYTNETIFDINFLPKKFVFIGGGPINCELGQAFSRLGAKVTILHTGARILEKETEEVSSILTDSFRKEGIDVIPIVTIHSIKNKQVQYSTDQNKELISVDADAVYIGIGRVLNIEGLDLEKAGVQYNQQRTKLCIDDALRTTNKDIYAVGDVAGNFQFTHAAEMHAKHVISEMLSPISKKFKSTDIAWVTYTSPQIATWGISKSEATTRKCEILHTRFTHDDRAIVDEYQEGSLSIYLNTKNQIVGGTLISENAGEISQELLLAMSSGIPVQALFNKVYPYPTASRINKQLVSQKMAQKLTKINTYILAFLFKIKS
ncbi:MAG: hypothetical protein RI996_201 [Candidatus Parcubacteria bacterium]|jgi:pyruvate/2-oxoglutarate dehydrogenase complex dihydrolipoamide dehydrogenase (E3) component